MEEEYEEVSRRLERSQIQESCAVRNVMRARRLARLLIDRRGEFQAALLPALIRAGQRHLYSLGPQRQHDAVRNEHILKVLHLLHDEPQWIRLLGQFTRPLSNKPAEELIREALQVPSSVPVTDAHTRQAVLSAWFCYLRQNVGSCFATAPAIMIHDEQPESFLRDLLDLISTGMLKRTFGGIENVVPLSGSWGSGDLKKPLLIRLSKDGLFPELWYSPGMLAALEAAGMLEEKAPLKERILQFEGWITSLMQERASPLFFSSAEEILRALLLKSTGLSEKELEEHARRPREVLQPSLLAAPFLGAREPKGLAGRCQQFFRLFGAAKNAFKSLADHALLKAWEFTLASFSDIKYELARWNFYASLGLGSQEPGGIGACIRQAIQDKLDAANQKREEIQSEYEGVYAQVKTLESRMRHASTEKEIQWLKIEYQSRVNEFYFLEEQRNAAHRRAELLVELYDRLYSLYVELFKDYFQEVYDAELQEVTTGPFDDSPAGFRLLYKHGRSHTAQWTKIRDAGDFIEALAAFFVATEPQVVHAIEEKSMERDVAEVVTAIVHHVRTKEFLESAFHRMAAAHRVPAVQDPLDHLDQIEKKPWVYTSGGTMNTLVSGYYCLEEKPKEAEKWVENEMELLVHVADTLKQLPHSSWRPYLSGKRRSLLMQSPSHAFLLKPFLSPFDQAWNQEVFTYTFIRDRFIQPAELFIDQLLLNEGMVQELLRRVSEKIPEAYLPHFQALCREVRGPSTPVLFRNQLAELLQSRRGVQGAFRPLPALDELDSLLYSSLPLFPVHELRKRVEKIVEQLPGLDARRRVRLLDLFDEAPAPGRLRQYLGAKELQDICKALLCLNLGRSTSPYDYHGYVSQAAQQLGFALPPPLLFADTNWVKELFGFVVSPGTGKLELWRFDCTGSQGAPMSSWKQWVNGSQPGRTWGIYTHPFQYGQN